jgi:hypothetical protein
VTKIVLHHIDDWAVGTHVLAALEAAGVSTRALGRTFEFSAVDTPAPFESIPEHGAIPEAEDALLAAAGLLARLGHALVDTDLDDERTAGFHWSADAETLARAATVAGLEVVTVRGTDVAKHDPGGAAIAWWRDRGKSDAEIIDAIARGRIARDDDGWLGVACLSFLPRMSELPESALRKLLELAGRESDDLRALVALACVAHATSPWLETLELATLMALSAAGGPAFDERRDRTAQQRGLATDEASIADLMEVFDEARGELRGEEKARFDALWERAVAREDTPLHRWVYALRRRAIDRPEFEAHAVAAFRRSVADGFVDDRGFGDRDGFAESVALVANVDPDLALAGLVALSSRFNEYGLRQLVPIAKTMPKRGYSSGALDAAAAHFARPDNLSAAKIFGKLLDAWGVTRDGPRVPPLREIDHVFDVGTDVATIIVGSFAAVEAIAAIDDDDLVSHVRKRKALGFSTGGDGRFRVRVIGVASARAALSAAEGTLLGVAPLRVEGDALTVSGVVGAGGDPTIPFPSGNYAARVILHERGETALTVVVYATRTPPKWPFGREDLPELA